MMVAISSPQASYLLHIIYCMSPAKHSLSKSLQSDGEKILLLPLTSTVLHSSLSDEAFEGKTR
jgi:hypothetical protein